MKLPNFNEMKEVASYQEEPLRFYRMPIVSLIFCRRLQIATDLLPVNPLNRILDVGYGCGAFLPELSTHCHELFGIDVHNNHHLVEEMLTRERIQATLLQGSVLDLPFDDAHFEAIVCLSVLEHIQDFRKAQSELVRVLKPGGVLIIGLPVENKITDFLFKIIKVDSKHNHVSRYDKILQSLSEELLVEQKRKFPSFLPDAFSGYICVSFKKPS